MTRSEAERILRKRLERLEGFKHPNQFEIDEITALRVIMTTDEAQEMQRLRTVIHEMGTKQRQLRLEAHRQTAEARKARKELARLKNGDASV